MLKVCGRFKGLIFYKGLIFPQSRKFIKIRAQSYFSGVYRSCSVKIIILTFSPNFPSRKVIFLIFRRNTTNTYRRHVWADFKFRFGIFIMRLYFSYLRANTLYIVSLSFFKYE
jgi:hypothetical protein